MSAQAVRVDQENAAVDTAEVAGGFATTLSRLEEYGIAASDIKKLNEAGVWTVEGVLAVPSKQLACIKGFSDVKVQKLKQAARNIKPAGFTTAFNIEQLQAAQVKITTGSKMLDELLGGGIESGSITELYGEFRTGKTQLCHMLAVACQLPSERGGGEGKCLYVDTEGTFRPSRLSSISDRLGLASQDVLENVAYAKAYNCEHQLELLGAAASMMSDSRFALIIVDSATALYRTEYEGRAELAARQNHLGKVVTNQVVANPGASMGGPALSPIGGNIMAHSSTTRLHLRKSSANTRVAKLVCSPNMPEADAKFSIGEAGIDDVTD